MNQYSRSLYFIVLFSQILPLYASESLEKKAKIQDLLSSVVGADENKQSIIEQAHVLKGHEANVAGLDFWKKQAAMSTKMIACMAFSADETLLATGYYDGTARVWDTQTGKPAHEFKHKFPQGEDWITGVAFSPDLKQLAITNGQRHSVWNIQRGICRDLRSEAKRLYGGTSMQFSPDGSMLAAGDYLDNVDVWDIEKDKYTQYSYSCLAYNKVTLATGGSLKGNDSNKTTEIPFNFIALIEPYREERRAAYNVEKNLLAMECWDEESRVVEVSKNREVIQTFGEPHFRECINSMGFSADGELLVTTGNDHKACIWGVSSGKLLQAIKFPGLSYPKVLWGPQGRKLAFSIGKDICLYHYRARESFRKREREDNGC